MQRASILSSLRKLNRLIRLIPDKHNRESAAKEATYLVRERSKESDPQKILDFQRHLASKIAYLRVITPKQHDSSGGGATFVLRDGMLVQGSGETRGSR